MCQSWDNSQLGDNSRKNVNTWQPCLYKSLPIEPHNGIQFYIKTCFKNSRMLRLFYASFYRAASQHTLEL